MSNSGVRSSCNQKRKLNSLQILQREREAIKIRRFRKNCLIGVAAKTRCAAETARLSAIRRPQVRGGQLCVRSSKVKWRIDAASVIVHDRQSHAFFDFVGWDRYEVVTVGVDDGATHEFAWRAFFG